MPRLPRLTAREAEARLLAAGYALVRWKGSHRIYLRGNTRIVVPFHAGEELPAEGEQARSKGDEAKTALRELGLSEDVEIR